MAGLADIQIIEHDSFKDHRGEMYTIYNKKDERYHNLVFNHDKICTRRQGTLVGIHGDFNTYKLVTCVFGEVYSVLVDYRKDSPDYLKHACIFLSGTKQLLLPPGIGNSFYVVTEWAVYNYKLSYTGEYTDADQQFTLRWNDPRLGIFWPAPESMIVLSERDAKAPLLPMKTFTQEEINKIREEMAELDFIDLLKNRIPPLTEPKTAL